MATLLEYIELCEGEKEMATIVNTMRRLGKDVDEVRQYLEKSTGKSLDDISDKELAFMAGQGAKAGQAVAPQADRDPELQKDFKDAQLGMQVPFVGPGIVAQRVRDKVPSGKYNVQTPFGNTVDIDVDISGDDLKAIKRATDRAGVISSFRLRYRSLSAAAACCRACFGCRSPSPSPSACVGWLPLLPCAAAAHFGPRPLSG